MIVFMCIAGSCPFFTIVHLLLLQVRAVWHNMREEPVVYVNGRPFVLREESRPLKKLREYSGIDGKRLEKMEHCLKDDILAEVTG